MVSLEENNQNRTWWYEQLNLSDDWNSMSLESRRDLTRRLKLALLDLSNLSISQEEMNQFCRDYDQSLVWDAILALADLSGKESKTHWELLAYLKKTMSGMWKAQHPSKQMTWQRREKEDDKEIVSASSDCVERNDPINFSKKFCSVCKRKLRVDNKTGVCARCQRRGNGKDSNEH